MALSEPQARRLLFGAAVTSVLGIAVAGTVDRAVGGVIVAIGWLAIVYGLHAFGRAEE